MKEIKDTLTKRIYWDEIPGKTIKRIKCDDDYAVIIFTDDSFLYTTIDDNELCFDARVSTYHLMDAELISKDIYEKAKEKEIALYAKKEKEENKALYLRLREQFEKER